jgi:hypothetical protein
MRTTWAAVVMGWIATTLPHPVLVQSADTEKPILGAATLSPQGPDQNGTGVAGTTSVRGTGNSSSNTTKDGITVTLTATDKAGVERFQYAVVTAAAGAGGGGFGGRRLRISSCSW